MTRNWGTTTVTLEPVGVAGLDHSVEREYVVRLP
jgi:hypothetical protein